MKALSILLLTILLPSMSQATADNQEAGIQASGTGKQLAPSIPRGKVTRRGLFRELESGHIQESATTSTGKVIRSPKVEFAGDTTRIPLRRSTYFGYRYWLKLPPDEYRPELKRVLIHPEMTLPDGSRVSRSARMIRKRATHGIVTSLDGYALSEDYELVEGDWTFQLWYADQLLLEQTFTTCRPVAETAAMTRGASGDIMTAADESAALTNR